jgi:hypothetical protein
MSRPDVFLLPIEPPDMHQISATSKRYLDRERVRRLRLMAGFASDESLARAAGISHGHLWQCLAGRTPAGPKVLTGLLRALPGTGLDDFVGSESADDSAVSA